MLLVFQLSGNYLTTFTPLSGTYLRSLMLAPHQVVIYLSGQQVYIKVLQNMSNYITSGGLTAY
jgi:hypothetical protein